MPSEGLKKRKSRKRHNPLDIDIRNDTFVSEKRNKTKTDASNFMNDPNSQLEEEPDIQVVPTKLSRRILMEAAQQQAEELGERQSNDSDISENDDNESINFDGLRDEDITLLEESTYLRALMKEEEETTEAKANYSQRLFRKRSAPAPPEEVLEDAHSRLVSNASCQRDTDIGDMPQDVKDAYKIVAQIAKHYRHGKLPKLFNMIPYLSNWEEILCLTEPDQWSAHTLREATKLFSSVNSKKAQIFYYAILLPAIRENISRTKKLKKPYVESLKKALFRPDAWLKGIILAMAKEDCTYREAVILGSLIRKVSLPKNHASAALVRLSKMRPWRGTTSIIIKAFLEKQYVLYDMVLESLVDHFVSFLKTQIKLPVVWHTSLLCFVENYHHAMSSEQKSRLRDVTRLHYHKDIGPEVIQHLIS